MLVVLLVAIMGTREEWLTCLYTRRHNKRSLGDESYDKAVLLPLRTERQVQPGDCSYYFSTKRLPPLCFLVVRHYYLNQFGFL